MQFAAVPPTAPSTQWIFRCSANHAPRRLQIPQLLHFDCDTVFPFATGM